MILIIGGGLFGLTTALELRKRGYENITVLDRTLPPAQDASSIDISRLVRPDYADPFYSRIAYEAMVLWGKEWGQYFHRSGLALIARADSHPYVDRCKRVLTELRKGVDSFDGVEDVRRRFPAFSGEPVCGYENMEAGWVDAEAVMRDLASKCADAGVSFIVGPRGTVSSLAISNGKITGVRDHNGGYIPCDRAILAVGAWTGHLLDLQGAALATCQPVGYIQLSPEESEDLAGIPAALDFTSGVVVFPPTSKHVLKVMRHGYGYETSYPLSALGSDRQGYVSGPRLLSRPIKPQYIPTEADEALRDGLAQYLPQFKDRPWLQRTLSWYTDTANGNFIISYHPKASNLLLATGCSGQ
jgi:sarcosine oxidase/L-pipecolate oxidase